MMVISSGTYLYLVSGPAVSRYNWVIMGLDMFLIISSHEMNGKMSAFRGGGGAKWTKLRISDSLPYTLEQLGHFGNFIFSVWIFHLSITSIWSWVVLTGYYVYMIIEPSVFHFLKAKKMEKTIMRASISYTWYYWFMCMPWLKYVRLNRKVCVLWHRKSPC